MTTAEVAVALGTTAPTVRSLLERGVLKGRKERKRRGFSWRVDRQSVRSYLDEHGEFRRRPRQARVGKREGDVDAIVAKGSATRAAGPDASSLRSRIVALEEALMRLRAVAESNRAAEDERAGVTEHLLAALGASQRAESARRQAEAELDEALAAALRPGTLDH
jgi:excisionase family DNA binding protein